jgi:hypothetical protein
LYLAISGAATDGMATSWWSNADSSLWIRETTMINVILNLEHNSSTRAKARLKITFVSHTDNSQIIVCSHEKI